MLKEFTHCFPKNLSRGDRRKLSIAIAIVSKPQVIILDEPTSGLDELSRNQIIRVILKLKQTRAILLVS